MDRVDRDYESKMLKMARLSWVYGENSAVYIFLLSPIFDR